MFKEQTILQQKNQFYGEKKTVLEIIFRSLWMDKELLGPTKAKTGCLPILSVANTELLPLKDD